MLAPVALAQRTAPAANVQDYAARIQAQRANSPADSQLRRGQKLAQICANCHGANGVSTYAGTPHLAGQLPGYLMEQMRKFADGRRKYPFMEGMIKAMNEQEKASVVRFYSQQTLPGKPVANAAQVAQGKDYYGRVCFRCHNSEGRGDDDKKIPRIAGQQAEYLRIALKRYRDGTGERMDPLMAENTRQLNDASIAAVAAYVSQMK